MDEILEQLDFPAPVQCTMNRAGVVCSDEAVWLGSCKKCEQPKWFCVCAHCQIEIRMTVRRVICRHCKAALPYRDMIQWRSLVGA